MEFLASGLKMARNWEHRSPNCGALTTHSVEEADEGVQRDALLRGRIVSLENMPGLYRVSKENGLGGVEDGEKLYYLDVDMGNEP